MRRTPCGGSFLPKSHKHKKSTVCPKQPQTFHQRNAVMRSSLCGGPLLTKYTKYRNEQHVPEQTL